METAAAFSPKDAIKKVGRGRTLSQDLTYDEGLAAFRLLLEGGFTAAQAGAFLQALRIKELTQDELNALVATIYERGRFLPDLAAKPDMTVNVASDTGRKGGLLALLAAKVLVKQGSTLALVRSTPVMSGNETTFTKTATLGLWPDRLLTVHIDDWMPNWSALAGLRAELGFRSCLHTAEKLIQPWPEAPVLLGISHRHYADRLAAAMQFQGLHGVIALGNHGTVDLVLHKPTEVVRVRPAGVDTHFIAPDMGGLKPDGSIYSLARFAEWPAFMQGSWPQGFADALILQTAFLAWCQGLGESVEALLPSAKSWVHAWGEGS